MYSKTRKLLLKHWFYPFCAKSLVVKVYPKAQSKNKLRFQEALIRLQVYLMILRYLYIARHNGALGTTIFM